MSKARDLADLVSTGSLLADGAVSVSEISDLTATAVELNVLDGITASTADLNNVAGINSDVQTQLDLKAPLASPTLTGTVTISGITYPTADGTSGQVLTTDGSGAVSFTTVTVPTSIDDLTDGYNTGNSVGVGTGALANNSGTTYNTAVGHNAGNAVTTGNSNVFIGMQAGLNTTGSRNSFVGQNAGRVNTSQSDNTYIGHDAGSAGSGSTNVAVGAGSLYYNTGSNNTAIGWQSLYGVSGSLFNNNTAIGRHAGKALTTGSNNVLLGYNANYNATSATNTVVIGTGATSSTTTATNEITLGNSSITDFRIPGLNISAAVNSFTINGWTITESGGSLYFATGGTNKMKLDASGNLDVVGNVNTNATIT